MSIIMGVNLSERLYLAGDSRLSYYENDKLYVRHDNMQKVENIPSDRSLTIASAGDARFAKYILSKLKTADFIKADISEIRNSLSSWLAPLGDEFFTQNGYTSTTLIIGGSDPTTRKIISGRNLIDMANAFTGGRGILRLNSSIQNAIPKGTPVPEGDIELDIPNTQLFSVKINRNEISFTDTKWGEFLMYGPEGLVKDDIELEDISKFEFDPSIINNGSGMGNDMALINAFIYSQAEKYNLSSIGGSVVAFANNCDGTTNIVTGIAYMLPLDSLSKAPGPQPVNPTVINSVLIQGNEIYREVNGTRYKLIPVSKYRPKKNNKLLL